MFDSVGTRTWKSSIVCFIWLIAFAFGQLKSGAATLSLAGVAEGSQIILPASASALNLPCTANVSGVSGSPEVVFSLEGHGLLLSKLTSPAPYAVTFSNLSAGKYFLVAQVTTATNLSADRSFDIVGPFLAPTNDLWAQAGTITDLSASFVATNTHATTETNEPAHAENGVGHSVWWSWQANVSGIVTATTAGSDFDTVLAVYTGTNVDALNLVSANDDVGLTNRSSQVSFLAVSGTQYSIAVDGAMTTNGSSASGKIQLRLLAAAPPSVNFTAPTNGRVFLTAFLLTNILASASIDDPAEIERVEFALDGGLISQRGTLSPPYQWSLTNLPPADYLLTVSARNTLGLISAAHASFSVIALAPEFVLTDPPVTPAGFQFAVTGLKGRTNKLQWATNLPAWNQLSLWTNFDGAMRFTDTNAVQFSTRFYRVISE